MKNLTQIGNEPIKLLQMAKILRPNIRFSSENCCKLFKYIFEQQGKYSILIYLFLMQRAALVSLKFGFD